MSFYSFDSSSDEAVEDGMVDMSGYVMVDVILGEERSTSWPRAEREADFEAIPETMRTRLTDYAANGGRLLITGAYVVSDLLHSMDDSIKVKTFADSVLHVGLATDKGARQGNVHVADTVFADRGFRFRFNTELSESQYAVESPDALRAVGDGAGLLLRYDENNLGAAVGYRGNHRVVVMGFPFESVRSAGERRALMRYAARYLLED